MGDIDETVSEAIEKAEKEPESRLNSVIAALVAVLATFMALSNIKDGNVVQAMAQAQAASIDKWAYYQSKSTKQHMAENMVEQLTIQRDTSANLTPQSKALFEQKIAAYKDEAQRYTTEKEDIKKDAEGQQKEYDRLNQHDDQFDMSEAGLSIAIALLGISALTRKKWLVIVALVFGGFGTLLGLAGFLGWAIHPDAIAKFLS
ncbi:MAG: DUF4337 domain-containing protein [Acidobacteria bacterium]|nr:DUF4337 domain-containing protein [Acidobacteriota bacterium]